MLNEADNDDELRGYVFPRDISKTRAGIYYKNELVGFMTPRLESIENQTWRTGAIYVLPEFRGKNIATKALDQFFRSRKAAPVPIGLDNKASQKAFENAGFSRSGIIKDDNGWRYEWWIKK
jgi:RimJ/RimL family protein N-acetyltransferase